MSQNNAKTNANSDSETNNKKISNNDSVIQLAVIQPRYNTNSNATTLSQEEEKNSLEKSHSNNLLDRDKNGNIENLLQDKEKFEIIEILHILDRLKGKLSGDSYLVIRVSDAFKELYEKYYAPKKPTLSPQTENIRRNILYSILDFLYETKFSKQDIKIQELFFKRCEDLGYPIGKVKKIKEEKPPIIVVQHIEENSEKEPKEKELKDEFKQKFKEFEKFLNELIFTPDNLINNAYLITKPLVKKLFQYIDELVNMDSTPREAKQLLIEMKDYLEKYPLNEKRFINGIASIPTGVHKQEITPKLTKIEKLLS
ncbi:MAG: hypothetical protein RXR08_14675 [Sulfolobaceae archaeon]